MALKDSLLATSGKLLGYVMGSSSKRDAARTDIQEMNGWNPTLNHAASTYTYDRERVMARSRDLDENNAWINGGLDRRAESVVGVKIRLSAQPKHMVLGQDYAWRMEWTANVQDRFDLWANDIDKRCDSRGKLSFGALARLAYLSYMRDGEVAAEIRDIRRGASNSTAVLLIEPERIETPPYAMQMEGPRLRGGVALDVNGRPTGYHVRSSHPNDRSPQRIPDKWDFIPARGRTGRTRFLHLMNPRRVEQERGIGRLAEAMVPSKMLDRVDRAEVSAALRSALLSIFIKSPGSTDDIEAALAPDSSETSIDPWMADYINYRGRNPVSLDGAQVTHLLPDEDVVAPERRSPNANYPDFAKFILQKVASSVGISYPQLTQDWAGINYSSARALLNEVWRSFTEDRTYFSQHFLTPIYAAWLEMEIAQGTVEMPGGPANFYRNKTAICMAEWIGPGRGSVDPKKEADANNLDIAAGRKSTVEAIYEAGRDPVDVLSEEQWYLEERERRGLKPPSYSSTAQAEGGEGEEGAGGTEDDRDGDGIPNEGERRNRRRDEEDEA